MPQDLDPLATNSPSGWPGGWYVYENGKVEGPLAAEDAFNLAAETADGKPRLVSRKGFSQWYALKDLSEIFKMTDQLGKKAVEAALLTREQLASAVAPAPQLVPHVRAGTLGAAVKAQASIAEAVAPAASVAPEPLAETKVPATIEHTTTTRGEEPPPFVAKTTLGTVTFKPTKITVAKPVIAGAAAEVPPETIHEEVSVKKESRAEKKKKQKGAKRLAAAADAPASVATAQSASPNPNSATERALDSQTAMMQEYFLQRGRLRLGKLRNPWVTAFVGLPMTLGAYWLVWFADLAREISFHAKGSDKSKLGPAALAIVPFAHIAMIYKLAKELADMEEQNRYKSVNPVVAAVFAIFPPFALAYLQDAANRHWLLHVKHSAVRAK